MACARMKCIARMAGALSAAALTVACTHAVGGTVRPAPGLKPRPLVGETIKQVLLDETQLSNLFNQHFKTDPQSPPRFGGADQLFSGYPSDREASPHDCVGVVVEFVNGIYQSSDIKNVAQETWWNADPYDQEPAVIEVQEGVVALPTARDADALFAKFSHQWRRCDGTTVTTYDQGKPFSTEHITDVRGADSVLTATKATHLTSTIRHSRALGVRVNCLVEVDIAYFSDSDSPAAVDIARRMMDTISKLS